MPSNSHIGQLIIKHLQDTLTIEESQTLEQWIAADEQNRIQFEKLTNSDWLQQAVSAHAESDIRIKERVFAELPVLQDTPTESPKRGWIRWMSVAAAVLIVASTTWYLWQGKTKPAIVAEHQTPVATVIPAGGNKATLTLADGTVIDLDKAGNGTIATEGKTTVNKKEDGQLEYKSATSTKQGAITYNMLSTPRGGQYQLLLPDGSKVWLNAASSIKYPTAFVGNERRVEITGEAYFEVMRDKSKPFKVMILIPADRNLGIKSTTIGGEVEVLGTHFNVNAYGDEESIKTTLIEGQVRVKSVKENDILKNRESDVVIKSAQQAIIPMRNSNRHITTSNDVDMQKAIAWKNGLFSFKDDNIRNVMGQIERWYDVTIKFEGNNDGELFSGEIYRNVDLSEVLLLLKASGIKFDLQGRILIVKP